MSPKKAPDFDLEFLPIANLKFDPENPRLPESIDGDNESQVLEWMLDDASLIELMGSIGEQGYFPGEPLLGYMQKDGTAIVVEGNRRLAAVKVLLDPNVAPTKKKTTSAISAESKNKPSELPIFIYPTREHILAYLGYRHVTGIKAWDPLAKAKYLKQLFDTDKAKDVQEKFRVLAKKIGSRSDYVARLLAGYSLYEKISENDFFGIKGLDDDLDFSILYTATSYSNLTGFLGLKSAADPTLAGLVLDRLVELVTWLFETTADGKTRIGESRNLKELNKIVENKTALEKWRAGTSLETAVMFTESPIDIFRISVINSREQLDIARSYSHLVIKPEKFMVDTLIEVSDIASDLYTVLRKRIRD